MDGRKRTVQIKFRVTEAERDLILEKMKLVPTRNMEAYLRKMAIDGYIIQVDPVSYTHLDVYKRQAIRRYPQVYVLTLRLRCRSRLSVGAYL